MSFEYQNQLNELIQAVQSNNEQLQRIADNSKSQELALLSLARYIDQLSSRMESLTKQIDLLGQRIQRYH